MRSFWKHFFLDNGDISLIEAGVQKYIPHQINNYKVKHDFVFHIVLDGQGMYRVGGGSGTGGVGDAGGSGGAVGSRVAGGDGGTSGGAVSRRGDGAGGAGGTGAGRGRADEATYYLGQQNGFLLKKNDRVYYEPKEDDPWTICWIGIGGNNLTDYLKDTRLMTDYVFDLAEDSDLVNNMVHFINFLMNANTGSVEVRMQIFAYLYHILANFNSELPLPKSKNAEISYTEPNLAEKVYDYIYSNYLEDITVESVAKHFDISRNYLFKLIKSYYGQPPKQIIQELRMNQASQLLRGSDKQVSEIAEIIGYADPFVFSKMFKNYYGHSPSQFRHLSDESIDEALFIRDKFLRLRPKGE